MTRAEYRLRNIKIWFLRQTDQFTYRELGEFFGFTQNRARQLCLSIDREIKHAAERESRSPTMRQTQRLIAAGALPVIPDNDIYFVHHIPKLRGED